MSSNINIAYPSFPSLPELRVHAFLALEVSISCA